MSKYFLLLFLLVFTQSEKTIDGEITYGFTPNNVSAKEKHESKELYDVIDKMNSASSELTFSLKFNSKESFFSLNETMDSDIKQLVVSYAKSIVSNGNHYYNISKNELLREANHYDNYTLLKSNPDKSNWELHRDTKKIDNYLCHKATKIKTVKNNSGDHHFLITAWYTMEIPLPFGPKEFNSLPGLILELKDSNFTFYAKSIKIDYSTEGIVKQLKSKRILTEEENTKNLLELRN